MTTFTWRELLAKAILDTEGFDAPIVFCDCCDILLDRCSPTRPRNIDERLSGPPFVFLEAWTADRVYYSEIDRAAWRVWIDSRPRNPPSAHLKGYPQ
jgi:hypothetical protein